MEKLRLIGTIWEMEGQEGSRNRLKEIGGIERASEELRRGKNQGTQETGKEC